MLDGILFLCVAVQIGIMLKIIPHIFSINRDNMDASGSPLDALFCIKLSNHVRMWELDYKEGWAPENWCFWTVVLNKTLENPLDSKEIKPVNSKGNQPWIFIRRTDAEAEAEAEALILWPPDVKSQLIGKDSDAWKDWRQKGKGAAEDEMVGWLSLTWIWANSRR